MGPVKQLSKEEVERIIGLKEKRWRRSGTKNDEIRRRIDECWGTYETYERIFRLRQAGFTYTEIAEKTGVRRGSVWEWLRGGRIPRPLYVESGAKWRLRSLQGNSSVKSFALGAIAASRKPNHFSPEFSLIAKEQEVLDHIVDPISEVFQVDFSSRHFNSFQGMREFNELTNTNLEVPWCVFETLEDKIEYFKGFLVRKGSFYRSLAKGRFNVLNLEFRFKSNPELGKEFAVLMFDLGMTPNYRPDKVSIRDYVDLKEIYRRGWCLLSSKREILRNDLRLIKKWPERISAGKLSELIAQVENGEKSRQEGWDLIKGKRVHKGTYDAWFTRKSLPRKIQRYRELEKLSQEVGDRGVISYVYNQLGSKNLTGGVRLAREIARKISWDQLDEIAYGGSLFGVKKEDGFRALSNLVFWKNYLSEEGGPCSSEMQITGTGVPVNYFFGMFVPEGCFDSPDKLKTVYSHLYVALARSPRFVELTEIKNGEIYVRRKEELFDLAETLVGGAGLGGKKRKLKEVGVLMENLFIEICFPKP